MCRATCDVSNPTHPWGQLLTSGVVDREKGLLYFLNVVRTAGMDTLIPSLIYVAALVFVIVVVGGRMKRQWRTAIDIKFVATVMAIKISRTKRVLEPVWV